MPTLLDDGPDPREKLKEAAAAHAKKRRSPKDLQVRETISTIYTMVGGLMQTVGSPKRIDENTLTEGDGGLQGTGMYLIGYADDVAEQWMDLADTNPRIKRMLYKLAEGGAAAPLLMTHIAILSPFLASRSLVPEGIPMMFMPESMAVPNE